MKASDINLAFTIIAELCGGIKQQAMCLPYSFTPNTKIQTNEAYVMVKGNLDYLLSSLNKPSVVEEEII